MSAIDELTEAQRELVEEIRNKNGSTQSLADSLGVERSGVHSRVARIRERVGSDAIHYEQNVGYVLGHQFDSQPKDPEDSVETGEADETNEMDGITDTTESSGDVHPRVPPNDSDLQEPASNEFSDFGETDTSNNSEKPPESKASDSEDGLDELLDGETLDSITSPSDVPDDIISELRDGGMSHQEFSDEYNLDTESIGGLIDALNRVGWAIERRTFEDGNSVWYLDDERDKKYTVPTRGDNQTFRFGLISDTHLGSQVEHLSELNDYYDRLQSRGISTVLHCGDISDGWKVYRHHVNELKSEAIGWNRLRDYVVDNYPERDSITTHFITGNHDYKYYKRNGIHFGKMIDDRRPDLNWLGEMTAQIVLDEESGIDFELIHPSGGQPYSLGYRLQTLYRERKPENRPRFASVGHLHGKLHAHAEGVEGFYPGCWQGATTYIKRKGLSATIGGWIVEIEIDGGEVRRVKTEWIGYETRDGGNEYSAESEGGVTF